MSQDSEPPYPVIKYSDFDSKRGVDLLKEFGVLVIEDLYSMFKNVVNPQGTFPYTRLSLTIYSTICTWCPAWFSRRLQVSKASHYSTLEIFSSRILLNPWIQLTFYALYRHVRVAKRIHVRCTRKTHVICPWPTKTQCELASCKMCLARMTPAGVT